MTCIASEASTPAVKLEVNGPIKVGQFSGTSAPPAGTIQWVGSDFLGYVTNAQGVSYWASLTDYDEYDPEVGTNTLSYVPRWTGTTLSSGTIYDNGINVGIGKNDPRYKLDVAGNANIDGTLRAEGVTITGTLGVSELNTTAGGTANMAPIAYGSIQGDGSIYAAASTSNFTVTHSGTGFYTIKIDSLNFHWSTATAVVSIASTSLRFITWQASGGNLTVFTWNSAMAAADWWFSFIVYKP